MHLRRFILDMSMHSTASELEVFYIAPLLLSSNPWCSCLRVSSEVVILVGCAWGSTI